MGWRAVFPLANITGLDLDALAVEQTRAPRIQAHVCNSMYWWDVDSTLGRAALFDLIVDDGAHHHEKQRVTWSNLWQYVRAEGLYIMEDVTTLNGAIALTHAVH